MILLDTNVVSELMKVNPAAAVIEWLASQASSQLYISTITIAEITYGIEALPAGNRKKALEKAFELAIKEAFQQRILTFDESAAFAYGKLMAQRKQRGRPLSILDGQMAAIAGVNNASVATRNIRDFEQCHVGLINPFEK